MTELNANEIKLMEQRKKLYFKNNKNYIFFEVDEENDPEGIYKPFYRSFNKPLNCFPESNEKKDKIKKIAIQLEIQKQFDSTIMTDDCEETFYPNICSIHYDQKLEYLKDKYKNKLPKHLINSNTNNNNNDDVDCNGFPRVYTSDYIINANENNDNQRDFYSSSPSLSSECSSTNSNNYSSEMNLIDHSSGFCEICRESFSDYQEHVESSGHKYSLEEDYFVEGFVEIDKIALQLKSSNKNKEY